MNNAQTNAPSRSRLLVSVVLLTVITLLAFANAWHDSLVFDDKVHVGPGQGNDLPVLVSEIPAVLVANASADVRGEALALAESGNAIDALYVAQGGFMGMNGNYTAGVLEGVVHYRPEICNWLTDPGAEVSANG